MREENRKEEMDKRTLIRKRYRKLLSKKKKGNEKTNNDF